MKNRRIREVSIVLLCCILFVYLAIGVNSIVNKNRLGLLSLRFYVMTSDSVESNIHSGDLVIAKNVDVEKIENNNIIIYKKDNEMFMKKVIRVNNEDGNVDLYIENDNVLSNGKLENTKIVGKVLYTIKGLGNVALFIQSPLGTLNVLTIVICICILISKISRNYTQNSIEEEISI